MPDPVTDPRLTARRLVRLVLGLGSVLLLAALTLAVREWAFIHGSVEATAVISDMEVAPMRSNTHWATDYRAGSGYRAVATFLAPDGRTVTVRSPIISRFTSLKAGDTIKVNYPPGRPDEAVLALFADRWLLPLILGGIGAVAFAIGAVATWMLHQPGTRVIAVRSDGLGRSTTNVLTFGTAAKDSHPPTFNPADAQRSSPIAAPSGIGRGIILAVTLGIAALVAFFWISRTRPAEETNSSSAAGIHALGYPDSLTVSPPTTAIGDDPPAPSAPAPALQTTDADKLTGMAATFLARPEQVAAAQEVLARQAEKLSLNCQTLRFMPGDLLVQAAPFPLFDNSGTLQRGLIRQRFKGVGCADRSPLFNVWTYADGSGAMPKTVAGYLGSTRADPSLLRDATPIVLGAAARLVPSCHQLAIMDTRLPVPVANGSAGPWSEEWLVAGCGRRVALTVRFIPGSGQGMTRIEVPKELARSLDPA